MMKKTLLALAASLAFVGVSQAQSVTGDTLVVLQVEQSCRANFNVNRTTYIETWFMADEITTNESGVLGVTCSKNSPYTIYNTNVSDGRVVLTDSDSGNTMLVGIYDNDSLQLLTDTVGFEGIATGGADHHYYDAVFNDQGSVRPAVGHYQGVINWHLVH